MSEIKVNKIKSQQGSDAFTIASNGGVTTNDSTAFTIGYLPAWRIGRDTDFNVTNSGTWTKAEWDGRDISAENLFMQNVTYSSGHITVPVAGIYQVNASARYDGLTANSGYFILSLQRNDVRTGNADTYFLQVPQSASYHSANISDVFKCNANDTLSVYLYSSNDTSWHISANTSIFSGVRIG